MLDELRKNSVCLSSPGHAFVLAGQPLRGTQLLLQAPPAPELATDLLRQVGLRGRNANRVEVPFAQVAPQAAELWSCETTEELRVYDSL